MDSLQADAIRLQIGHTKQFFFDNVIIESVQNLTRRLHSPEKVAEAPLIQKDKRWEQVTYFTCSSWRVIRDPADGIFKCWYEDWQMDPQKLVQTGGSFHNPAHFPSRYLFARSEDGLHWEKPELGVRIEEGYDTNIVLGDRDFETTFGSVHSGYVFLDRLEEDEEHRFKILFNHRTPDKGEYEFASSPDGIHWQPWGELPHFGCWGAHLGDVLTISFDLDERTYILNTRHPRMGAGWFDPQSPVLEQFSRPYCPDQPWRTNKRRIFQARSADLIHWSEPQPIVVPDDELDNLDDYFYGMKQYNLDGMWIGFLDVFHNTDNTMDVQLVYSRDGRNFRRVQPGRPWLPHGEPGSWDQYMVNTYGGPVQVGDELYVYHGGAKNHHDWWIVGAQEGLEVPEATDMDEVGYCLGLARMKTDRFISLGANAVRQGILVTRPFASPGGELVINAQCNPGGYVQAEVAGGNGEVIDGFEKDNCLPFTGDAIDHQVIWQNKRVLPEGWLKVHFYISDAQLYTFQLRE